jgi:hypothetical protein
VNFDAESAIALAGAQLPNAAVSPTILMFCPNVVSASSLKVIDTLVGQELEGPVVVGDVPWRMSVGEQARGKEKGGQNTVKSNLKSTSKCHFQ